MNKEQQRIAIAESMGYKKIDPKDWWGWDFRGIEMMGDMPFRVKIPDYLNDLNAMHEAEKVLNEDQQHVYEAHLLKMEYPNWSIKVTHATAAQRARAFLETLGLWDNGSA